ncbi:Serine/threonine-protein phosphatase 2A regulatory subunit B'' subunit gamma [Perkinsus olseni]|uniref:Serine/threonine-protein phosphatase 2A regulatory subunit B'' subunit gamma n=1 Tax=Perkinsus olseni TaxID=32597 RepID=A0A7J6L018_PEROL|nr:Serine/threonine-protein phosphatase 2A regulatory subunit B'' subunit gamma [Perkinsus olseni]
MPHGFAEIHAALPFRLAYACRMANLHNILTSLHRHDVDGRGYLTGDTLEDWLFEISKHLAFLFDQPQVRKTPEQFLPLWVFTAAHTIGFLLGGGSAASCRDGPRISIERILSEKGIEHVIDPLMSLRRVYVEDMTNNLFSRFRSISYYDSFFVFGTAPVDTVVANGQASLNIFNRGYMNPLFTSRLVKRYNPVQRIMDYRTFLDFCIAWENRDTPQGAKYFWRILDWRGRGWIDRDDLSELAQAILNVVDSMPGICGPNGPPPVETLVSEIYDLLVVADDESNPDGRIALPHVLKHTRAFGTVVGFLANTDAFIEYEAREEIVHEKFSAKLEKEKKDKQYQQKLAFIEYHSTVDHRLQQCLDGLWGNLNAHENAVTGGGQASLSFAAFREYLNYHESVYAGVSVEPGLNAYYEWEESEARQNEHYRQLKKQQVNMQLKEISASHESELVIDYRDD